MSVCSPPRPSSRRRLYLHGRQVIGGLYFIRRWRCLPPAISGAASVTIYCNLSPRCVLSRGSYAGPENDVCRDAGSTEELHRISPGCTNLHQVEQSWKVGRRPGDLRPSTAPLRKVRARSDAGATMTSSTAGVEGPCEAGSEAPIAGVPPRSLDSWPSTRGLPDRRALMPPAKRGVEAPFAGVAPEISASPPSTGSSRGSSTAATASPRGPVQLVGRRGPLEAGRGQRKKRPEGDVGTVRPILNTAAKGEERVA